MMFCLTCREMLVGSICLLFAFHAVAYAPTAVVHRAVCHRRSLQSPRTPPSFAIQRALVLKASNDNGLSDEEKITGELSESDQKILGVAGCVSSFITLYSEYVLKETGCGLNAGPYGLVGAAEGLSYLGVAGIGAFSLYKKFKTGSGLPSGPGGLLGAAEGLSFVAISAGLIVLILQVINYGYIPNAVPMEGGMCS